MTFGHDFFGNNFHAETLGPGGEEDNSGLIGPGGEQQPEQTTLTTQDPVQASLADGLGDTSPIVLFIPVLLMFGLLVIGEQIVEISNRRYIGTMKK